MRNIKLTIEYDGTRYCGWQVQKNGLSIQKTLQNAIEDLVSHEIKLTGASRTDAKVHAKAMVANFYTSSKIPVAKFPPAINCALPDDIAVIEAEEADASFHSRYNSKGKKYGYVILNRRAPSPLLKNHAAHVPQNLDVSKMKEAAKYIIGTHDFSAFKASGSSIRNNVRTVSMLDIKRQDDIIKIEIKADGFLYNMVRIIVGTLIEVGSGKIPPDSIEDIINGKDRRRAGKTAPPQGLYLETVYY
jgi:tRNA pseudouridine38-40 synthase